MEIRKSVCVKYVSPAGEPVTKYFDPLAFRDTRYQALMTNMGREAQTKFLKFYKRSGSVGAERPEIEMAAWLATFAFQQLAQWTNLLAEDVGVENAALRTFSVFGTVFEHLTKEMMPEIRHDKTQGTVPTPVDIAAVTDPSGEATSDEAAVCTSAISIITPEDVEREAGNDADAVDVVAVVGEVGDGAGDSERNVVGDDTVTR